MRFRVLGVPVPEPRKRARIVNGKSGKWIQFYTIKTHPVNGWKTAICGEAIRSGLLIQEEGPVDVSLLFLMPRVAGRRWKRKKMERGVHCRKPDVDNLAKAVLDALTGLAWQDDSQVMRLLVMKVESGDESPGVEIEIVSGGG